jgi:hypothetical protein
MRCLAVTVFAVAFSGGALLSARAQAPDPSPQQTQTPDPATQEPSTLVAPPKPYKVVPVFPPQPHEDPSFTAFRRQLADVAARKDRAALAKLVVAKNFFWEQQDGDAADEKLSGIENFEIIFRLDDPESGGWDMLARYAEEETANEMPERPDTLCAPADPDYSDLEFQAVVQATHTTSGEWGYVVRPDTPVHATPQPDSPVIDTLGVVLVRALYDDTPPADTMVARIVTPAGKVGYVPVSALAPLTSDQVCYTKTGGTWQIAGVIGGGGVDISP